METVRELEGRGTSAAESRYQAMAIDDSYETKKS
jgi:hypothetical protein